MKKISLLLCLQLFFALLLIGQNTIDEMENQLNEIWATSGLPGFGMAIVDHTGTIYQNGFGYADLGQEIPFSENSIINIGSISKTFIGVSLMIAIEKGYLNLDTDINEYLPFKIQHPKWPAAKITLRHLATHSSGIRDRFFQLYSRSYVLENGNNLSTKGLSLKEKMVYKKARRNQEMPLGDFLKACLSPDGDWYKAKNFSKFRPGTQVDYTNIGAALAAYVIECSTGQSYAEFVRQEIFEKLNMTNTGWRHQEFSQEMATRYLENGAPTGHYFLNTYPDGGVLTSIADLSNYLTEMIKGKNGQGQLLLPDSYKVLFAAQSGMPGLTSAPNDDLAASGLFWDVNLKGNFGHNGGDPGITTIMRYSAEHQFGKILFINMDFESKQRMNALRSIWKCGNELFKKQPPTSKS